MIKLKCYNLYVIEVAKLSINFYKTYSIESIIFFVESRYFILPVRLYKSNNAELAIAVAELSLILHSLLN